MVSKAKPELDGWRKDPVSLQTTVKDLTGGQVDEDGVLKAFPQQVIPSAPAIGIHSLGGQQDAARPWSALATPTSWDD